MTSYQITPQAQPIWTMLAGIGTTSAQSVLLVNTSNTDYISLGTDQGLVPWDSTGNSGPPAGNITIMPPQSSIALTTQSNWYAATDATDSPILQVTPDANSWSASPLDIAQQIVDSGIALDIAEQIAATGVSLLGGPTLLYDIPSETISGTPGPVGSTVSYLNFPSGTTESQAIAQFNTACGRTMQIGKIFFDTNSYPTSINSQLQGYIDNGMQAILNYKPPFNPTTQAALTSIINSVNALKGHGLNVAMVLLWEEPQNTKNNLSAAQNIAMHIAYNSPVTGIFAQTGVPVWYDAAGSKFTEWASYAPVTPNTTQNYVQGVAVDAYADVFTTNNLTLATIEAVADNAGLPFGVLEVGVSADEKTIVTQAEFEAFFLGVVMGTMAARLSAGKVNGPVIYYNDTVTTSPNMLVPTNNNTPYRQAILTTYLPELFDTLTGSVNRETIGAGLNPVMIPLAPSPNAGYASVDGISYDAVINLIAGAGSTIPFAAITISWFNDDSDTALPVDQIIIDMPMGTNGTGGTVITGKGPQRGQFQSIQISNHDTVACSVQIQINLTSRSVMSDIWKWDVMASVAVPTYTLAGGSASFRKCLGVVEALSIPGNGSESVLMGMCPGNVFVRVNATGSGKVAFTLTPQPPLKWTTHSTLLNEDPSGEFEDEIILPTAPCMFTFTNTDSVAHTVDATIISLD